MKFLVHKEEEKFVKMLQLVKKVLTSYMNGPLALPFAYLFCESEGLPFFGNKRGLMARAKETILTLILLSFVIMGLMYILAALIDWDRDSFDRLISKLPIYFLSASF